MEKIDIFKIILYYFIQFSQSALLQEKVQND